MAQPPTYNRLTSFSNLTALSPSAPPPGASLDAEYNAIKTTLDAILADLALIQNDDTTLANLSVGPAQLSTELTAGFTAPSAWVTGGVYTASPASCVLQSSKMYLCLVSHTAGVFATDLAAGKWLQIFDLTSISLGTAAQVAVTSHGSNVATNVQVSLNNLDDNKAATSHTHVSTQISDSTSAGRAFLTAANVTAQQTLLGLGSLAFLNSVTVTSSTANWAFTGKISPAQLTTNTNDWPPTGLATAVVIEVNTSASTIALSGLLATTDGDIKILDNVGTNNLILLANSASSASANRFSLPRPLVLRPGQSVVLKYDLPNTIWRVQSPVPTNPVAGASFKNLALGNGNVARNGFTAPASPDATFLVTYDELVLEDGNGETWRVASGSHTISTATTGAVNGLESAFSLVSAAIFVWVIGNPITNTVGGLMSVSATAPTLPSGYTFKARVGGTFTDSSSHLLRTMQFGRDARYIPQATTNTATYPIITSGVGTMTNSTFNPTTVSVAAFVPSTATQMLALVSCTAGSTACAPNASFNGVATSGSGMPPLASGAGSAQGWIDLESASVFYGATSGATNGALQAIGWTDSL